MTSTFTLTGTFTHQDNVTPVVGARFTIAASPFPLGGLLQGAGQSVVTDGNGQFSVVLTTGVTGLYYVITSQSRPSLLNPNGFRFAAPAAGTTLDVSSLVFYNPPGTEPILADVLAAAATASAASAAAVAAASAVQLGMWAASTPYASGQTVNAPDGSPIKSNSTRTSRSSFDATEQGNWTPVATTSGTLDRVALDGQYVNSQAAPTAHAPALGWFFPEAAGAVGDGTTDDKAAFAAVATAVTTGGKIILHPTKTYVIDAAVSFAKACTIVGNGATIKKGSTTVSGTWFTLGASGVRLENVNFSDSTAKVTGTFIATSSSSSGCQVTGCTVNASAAIVISLRAGGVGHRVENNTISGCVEGVRSSGTQTGGKIIGNTITGWSNRGIYVVADAGGAPAGLQIVRNDVSAMVTTGAGTSRYPITVQAVSGNAPEGLLIEGNRVTGIGHSFTDGTTPGTADGIALIGCINARVAGNISTDGGDEGITIGTSCVNVTVTGNVCLRNDTGGIIVNACQDVSVTGNLCKNNGQNKQGDRTAQARCGIVLTTAANVKASGNTLGDDQGTKTQQYGYSVTASTNCDIGPDVDAGNSLGLHMRNGTGNSGINIVGLKPTVISAEGTQPANTTTETAQVTHTIKANVPQAGTTYRVTLGALIQNQATSGSLTLRLRYGGVAGTILASLVIPTQAGAASGQQLFATFLVTFRAGGASGTAVAVGHVRSEFGAVSAAIAATSSTANSTSDKDLVVTTQWATASATNVFNAEVATIEVVKL